MNFQEAKQYALLQQPDFLPHARRIGGRNSYVCPCCENGAGKDGTGITMIPGSGEHPLYHCFKCDFTGDIFRLAMEYYGLDTAGQAMREVFRYLDITPDHDRSASGSITKSRPETEKKPEIQEEPEPDYLAYIKKCADDLDPSYLLGRGISEKTQRHYMVGTDKSWVNPTAVERYQKEGRDIRFLRKSPRCIIPTSSRSYLARDTRENLSETLTKYAKQKIGKIRVFNEKYAANQNVIFVTEGEIDAMSIHEASEGSYEAIGLGSTANWRRLVQIEENNGYKPLILALDNDDAGRLAAEKITEAIQNKAPIVMMEYEGKDPNSVLQKDITDHTSCLKQAIVRSMDQMIEKLSERQLERTETEPELEIE